MPSPTAPDPSLIGRTFEAALRNFDQGRPVLVMAHNDADGLASAAILTRALRSMGRDVRTRILGRGETPWSQEVGRDLAAAGLGGLVVADLGTRAEPVLPGVPTVILDHHVPRGRPAASTVITGYDLDPVPNTSLLALWAVAGMADVSDLLWIAALGMIGDMTDGFGFPEMAEARRRYGTTALREATSLVNAPRRSSSGDPSPALALLLRADGPKEVAGTSPEAAALRAARDEVKAAMAEARKVGPKVRDGVALLRFDSPCQVHPLLAQTWRGRLKREIVLAANAGFRPGWVHFAARTAREVNLVEFLARHAPPGADENYGGGHPGASGGALRLADWDTFVSSLGFGPDAEA